MMWWSKTMIQDAIPLFHEYYMSHEIRLTGVDNPPDHTMTSNYTPDTISCFPGYWNKELEAWTSSVV